MNLDTFLPRRNSNCVKSHEEKDEPSIQLTIDPATSINLLNRSVEATDKYLESLRTNKRIPFPPAPLIRQRDVIDKGCCVSPVTKTRRNGIDCPHEATFRMGT